MINSAGVFLMFLILFTFVSLAVVVGSVLGIVSFIDWYCRRFERKVELLSREGDLDWSDEK
jgi:hypothetical protein